MGVCLAQACVYKGLCVSSRGVCKVKSRGTPLRSCCEHFDSAVATLEHASISQLIAMQIALNYLESSFLIPFYLKNIDEHSVIGNA